MSSDLQRLALVAVGFVVLFATGFWLARGERPYGVALFGVHKLAAVAVLAYLGGVAYGVFRAGGGDAVFLASVALAVVGFLALIASGGAMSAMESAPSFVPIVHKVAPYVTTVFTIVALYVVRTGAP